MYKNPIILKDKLKNNNKKNYKKNKQLAQDIIILNLI